uniref:Uncharacterized protein n=1 Tax=Accipiter nisus TaxID=211598 RepID=A0A8B9NIP3_9AVES
VKRNGSRSCLNRSRVGSRERDWLKEDAGRGCVYVHGRDSAATASSDLRLVLCTTRLPCPAWVIGTRDS